MRIEGIEEAGEALGDGVEGIGSLGEGGADFGEGRRCRKMFLRERSVVGHAEGFAVRRYWSRGLN